MATLDELLAALSELEGGPEQASDTEATKATSLRLPEPLHRAAMLATELGMDDSLTAATVAALHERIRRFVRQRALAEHFAAYPADRPGLSDVARRRVAGTDHPAASRPRLVAAAAEAYARANPEWLISGRVDDAVDAVLDQVETLAVVADPASGATAGHA